MFIPSHLHTHRHTVNWSKCAFSHSTVEWVGRDASAIYCYRPPWHYYWTSSSYSNTTIQVLYQKVPRSSWQHSIHRPSFCSVSPTFNQHTRKRMCLSLGPLPVKKHSSTSKILWYIRFCCFLSVNRHRFVSAPMHPITLSLLLDVVNPTK